MGRQSGLSNTPTGTLEKGDCCEKAIVVIVGRRNPGQCLGGLPPGETAAASKPVLTISVSSYDGLTAQVNSLGNLSGPSGPGSPPGGAGAQLVHLLEMHLALASNAPTRCNP